MPTTVAIRHVAFEDLGTLAPVLAEAGHSIRYVDAAVDDLTDPAIADADLLVVLGGPVGVGDLETYPVLTQELDILRERLTRRAPTLGVCLGAQLMAAALGAPVRSTGRKEIGFSALTLNGDSVLRHLEGVPVLHWHGDEFAIPEGSVSLASTPGFDNQAFAVGDHALALQFHIEADATQIERWLIGHANEIAGAGIDPRTLRADAARYGAELAGAAARVMRDWLPS